MSEEDITQDTEYIRGYEEGMQDHRKSHTVYHEGYYAGLTALMPQRTVERKQTLEERFELIENQQTKFDERLAKLEKYTQE